jgi:hypothetical protein
MFEGELEIAMNFQGTVMMAHDSGWAFGLTVARGVCSCQRDCDEAAAFQRAASARFTSVTEMTFS